MEVNNEIIKYVNEKKYIYDLLFIFLDSSIDYQTNFQNLINFIDKVKLKENHEKLEHFLQLLNKLSSNHQRSKDFLEKIYKILLTLSKSIKQTLSNLEIFSIFKNNKLILLFLLENKIITFDQNIVNCLMSKNEVNEVPFYNFFFPEIRPFIQKDQIEKIESSISEYKQNYESFRKNGQNASYVCNLIRQDLIKEFIFYVNKRNLSLDTTIESSIFETNAYLIKKNPTFIEYAAFNGSIKIFNFLYGNDKRNLTSSLWLYAIHGRNAKIIHILEDNEVKLPNNSYYDCVFEAIKCHHNEIADYFLNNFVRKIDRNLNDEIVLAALHHHNYQYLTYNLINNYFFLDLYHYNYSTIVNIFLKSKENIIKAIEIQTNKKF